MINCSHSYPPSAHSYTNPTIIGVDISIAELNAQCPRRVDK